MSRLVPTRAGIINLWDYRDEEFQFVDGWLVLRGPNGSGKTKALEVLFPFVLDGRIEPRRLNPFAGEDRTMKSNLLYRGQESAHAYVWMEFGDGTRHVTIGIGLRAHRHNDRVTRWHFVASGRIGVDLSLLDADDRPVTRKDLIAALGADAVRDSAEEYRHLVDAALFGLGAPRYEQLLDLVLTLRKPQLAKDLNPVELSRTLQRGLRPVEDTLLVEAARSFDDMEAVADTLEGLIEADAATTAFLTVYATYLRTHARGAADALTARRAAADDRARALTAARAAADEADRAAETSQDHLRVVEGEPARLRAHLDRLKGSAAYQSHEQLADLQRHTADLDSAVRRATDVVAAEQDAAARRRTEWERALVAARDAQAQAGRLAGDLATDAGLAGIDWGADDPAPDGLTARVSARVTGRRADLRVVREHAARLEQADRGHTRAAAANQAARQASDDAAAVVVIAEEAVEAARRETVDGVRRWADRHDALLTALDLPGLPEALVEAVGTATLKDVYTEAVAAPVAVRREQVAALIVGRQAGAAERAAVQTERDLVAAEHDDAPPAGATRPASREDRPGAPLWRLVRFADAVSDADAAGFEAALHAAGLLDAWIHPSAEQSTADLEAGTDDAYLRAGPPAAGPSLADVLLPEQQDRVSAARVRQILAGIALDDLDGVTASGRWAQGSGFGRFTKQSCEYIGATARAARRAARLAEFDRRLAGLDAELARLDAEQAALTAELDDVRAAGDDLPAPTALRAAERGLDQAATVLRLRHEAAAAATAALDAAVAERAAAETALRRAAAERSLPVEQLDAIADAVDRFAHLGVRLEAAHQAAAATTEATAQAEERHLEAAGRLENARAEADNARQRHTEKAEELRTLRDAIGAEADDILAQVAATTEEISAADAVVEKARAALSAALQARAAATARVELGAEALDGALREARQEAQRLRPYAQSDLLGLIRCPTTLRWPDLDTDGLDPAVIALHEAILAATRELTPSESSLKQSATRLTTALAELQAQLPAAGLDHRPEWDTDDGVIIVRVADEQGRTPVAHFAERITRERRDQEQLLTDAEQQVFEDALLGQLARQIHHRTIEARDLVDAMDTQMRARRMSSGLTVGVGWRLADDLDAEQREVCKLLERDPARLGPAELTTLRRHFATRIKAARSVSPEKSYRDLLADVLDYRRWRVFAFTLHRPGGPTEQLTRARHSQLSGGEQSVSLHLPLFAAANAIFGSARPDAPRLLGLDEAFAGVDDNGRGELMSLATQFDLDLFMTGYDLWATHPAVTGAAHYDLSHSAVDHTVSTILLVWDGATNIADFDGTLTRALGSPDRRRVPALLDD